MYERSLHPIDTVSADASSNVVETALIIAREFGARLYVLTGVHPSVSYTSSFFQNNFIEAFTIYAQRKLSYISGSLDIARDTVHLHVLVRKVYDKIIILAKIFHFDLIFMALNRRSFFDYLLGPNAARVVFRSDCSGMVARLKSGGKR